MNSSCSPSVTSAAITWATVPTCLRADLLSPIVAIFTKVRKPTDSNLTFRQWCFGTDLHFTNGYLISVGTPWKTDSLRRSPATSAFSVFCSGRGKRKMLSIDPPCASTCTALHCRLVHFGCCRYGSEGWGVLNNTNQLALRMSPSYHARAQ